MGRPKLKKPKSRFEIRIDEELKEQFANYAEEHDTTMTLLLIKHIKSLVRNADTNKQQ